MKPARGPKTDFYNNYCNGIPGLANYEMPTKCAKASLGTFLGTVTAVPGGTAVTDISGV